MPYFHFTFFIAGGLADVQQETNGVTSHAGIARGKREIIPFRQKDPEATIQIELRMP